jgi:hypothetical protein
MARRGRSRDITPEIMQLGALFGLAAVFIPGFAQVVSGIGAAVVALLVLGLSGFVVYRIYRRHTKAEFEPALGGSILPTALPTFQPVTTLTHRPTAAKPTLTLSERLHRIDWFQFEKLMAAVYKKLDYAVTLRGGANPDGGIDMIIEKDGVRSAVQCKHWKTRDVEVRTVRELLGAMAHTRRFRKGRCLLSPDSPRTPKRWPTNTRFRS